MIEKLITKLDVNIKAIKSETNCTFRFTINIKNMKNMNMKNCR